MGALDGEFARWLATLGVGGVLAGFMFMFYRKDVRQFTDLWKVMAEQLMEVVKENTVANTKLITMIEAQERNAIRKTDIVELIRDHRNT
jgi:hypothetical protein